MIDYYLYIALFVICLVFSAFFSSSEVALIAINRVKVRTLINEGRKGAEALAQLKEHPDHILITILIGNNIANIGAAAIATAIAIALFGDPGIGLAIGVVFLILIILGEIGPRLYASRANENFALSVAPSILLFSKVLAPVIWVVDRVSRSHRSKGLSVPVVTEEEIKEWIDVGQEGGSICPRVRGYDRPGNHDPQD
jgi:putative hemolysin